MTKLSGRVVFSGLEFERFRAGAVESRLDGAALVIEGLKYKKLSIKKLKLKRVGETDEDDEHAGGKAGAISRLLSRIIDSTEDEEDEDE